MNNKTVKTFMVVAIIFTLSLYFIGGTYARYTGDFTGDATAQVAEWSVNLDGKGEEQTTMDLTFTPTENENVVDDKIAPGSTATANATIDLTGTEVAVDVIVEATDEGLQQAIQKLGLNDGEIKFTSDLRVGGSDGVQSSGKGTEAEPYKITLPNSGAFISDDKLHITLTLTWDNQDTNDSKDTEAGKKAESAGEITIPVKMTVKQHIDAE